MVREAAIRRTGNRVLREDLRTRESRVMAGVGANMLSPDARRILAAFLKSVEDVPWFAQAGKPNDTYVVVPDAVVAWDKWNDRMLKTWLLESTPLEQIAKLFIGDAAIDEVFKRVSQSVQWPIRKGLDDYFGSRPETTPNTECGADLGLWPEILEFVERDVAWAAVETILAKDGFFNRVLEVHREGRWPCSWDGSYPNGRFAVL